MERFWRYDDSNRTRTGLDKMFRDTVAEFVEEERRSIKPPTIEISTEDFLNIV